MNSSIGTRSGQRAAGAVFLVFFTASFASAARFSETGTLSSPEDTVLIALKLNAGDELLLNTYGFGGGTNYAGNVIPVGGFDSFIGLFSGTGSTALFINGDSDILSNYSPGCPPAGLVTIGSVPGQCGDVDLAITGLTAGTTYTILLSDGAYVPEAVFESAPAYLGDGFADLTGGVFQTCYDADDCNNDTGNWALDISAPEGSFTIVTPEPAPFELAALAIVAGWVLSKKKVRFHKFNQEIQIVMTRLPKFALSFGAAALAAGVLTVAVPQAAHAVAAALVQVTNTSASPAIMQGVPTLAAQLVDISNSVLPSSTSYTPFYSISPNATFDLGYTIPSNQSLVITAVDVTPFDCTPTSYAGTSSVGLAVNSFNRNGWTVSGQTTTHFAYPAGLVLAAGSTPQMLNASSACTVTLELHGYLTYN